AAVVRHRPAVARALPDLRQHGAVDGLGVCGSAGRRSVGIGCGSRPPSRSHQRRARGRAVMAITLLSTMLLAFAFSISIAVAIGGSAMLGIALFEPGKLILAPKEMFTAIDKFPLAAIPFFILAGNLMETGGISRRLV